MVRKDKDQFLHLNQIAHYVKTGLYSESVQSTEKNGIRKAAKNMILKGKLYF